MGEHACGDQASVCEAHLPDCVSFAVLIYFSEVVVYLSKFFFSCRPTMPVTLNSGFRMPSWLVACLFCHCTMRSNQVFAGLI